MAKSTKAMRVGQPHQQALPEGRNDGRQFFIGGLQNLPAAIEARHGAPVQLREQIPLVARDDINQVFIQRFAR